MKRYGFHIALLTFAAGIGVASVRSVDPFLLAMGAVAIGAVALVWRRRSEASSAPFFLLLLCVVSFLCGAFRMEYARFEVSPFDSVVGQSVTYEGIVVREPDIRSRTQHLYITVNDELILVTTDRYLPVSYGDRITVTGAVSVPERFTTELGREFNYEGYLRARGVTHMIEQGEIEVEGSSEGSPFIHTLLKGKHALMSGIESVLGEPHAGLGEGLLLGVKQALGEELEDVFRTAGITHIVVLSGYNILLVVTFSLFLLSMIPSVRVRTMVGIGVIVAFAFMVGLSATVVRASIMASLALLAGALGRSYDLLRALLLAGAIMLMVNPHLLLYDIGFQLSFMATLGLVLVAPTLEVFFLERGRIPLKEYLFSTLATQIAVLPLLMYHIGEVSLVAVVVNLLVLPAVPFAMAGTCAAGLIALLSPSIALPIAFLASLVLGYIVEVATFAASLPFAAISIPVIAPVWVCVLYAVFAVILFGARFKKEKDTLQGWIIEEETETGEALRASPVDSPIFFR